MTRNSKITHIITEIMLRKPWNTYSKNGEEAI